jgi:hypothetical protein
VGGEGGVGGGERERIGEGGRNDPSIVCTYELKKLLSRKKVKQDVADIVMSHPDSIAKYPSFFWLCVPSHMHTRLGGMTY